MSDQLLAARYINMLSEAFSVVTFVIAEKCPGLPSHLKGITRLDIGLNMPVPIHGLNVDPNGIRGTFSFNRVSHDVTIPWNAVEGAFKDDDYEKIIAEKTTLSKQKTAPSKTVEGNVTHVNFGKKR